MNMDGDNVTDQDLLASTALQPSAESGLYRFPTEVNPVDASRLG